jgi:hypothetical protein
MNFVDVVVVEKKRLKNIKLTCTLKRGHSIRTEKENYSVLKTTPTTLP